MKYPDFIIHHLVVSWNVIFLAKESRKTSESGETTSSHQPQGVTVDPVKKMVYGLHLNMLPFGLLLQWVIGSGAAGTA